MFVYRVYPKNHIASRRNFFQAVRAKLASSTMPAREPPPPLLLSCLCTLCSLLASLNSSSWMMLFCCCCCMLCFIMYVCVPHYVDSTPKKKRQSYYNWNRIKRENAQGKGSSERWIWIQITFASSSSSL